MLNTGQILSLPMIAIGAYILVSAIKKNKVSDSE
jgi:prolipoprotein diacylglyceryltransferase